MRSRRLVGLLAVAAMLSLAGCADLAGNGPIVREASEASIEGHEALGYAEYASERRQINRTFEIAGQTREVHASNYQNIYLNRSEDGSPQAVVGVVTTPQFRFAGRAFNPIAEASNRELVEFGGSASPQYGTLQEFEARDDRTVELLDTETTLTTFDAVFEDDEGTEIEGVVSATKVEHGNDIVVVVSIHTSGTETALTDGFFQALLDSVDH